MIPSHQGNRIFVSSILAEKEEFKPVYQRLKSCFKKHQIPAQLLEGTKDIWCRDYMPIQVDNQRFVQFRYEPNYLKDYPELQTDGLIPFRNAGFKKVEKSTINLDGGNVISNGKNTLISSRIFQENPEYQEKDLIAQLEKLLESKIIIIPQVNSDFTGHVDGMMRFVDDNTLVGNHRELEFKYWRTALNKVLKEHNLNYIDFPFNTTPNAKHPYSAEGCYMNFVDIEDCIFFPVFNHALDQKALALIEQIFPHHRIFPILMNEVATHGGVLNCITWVVKGEKRIISA